MPIGPVSPKDMGRAGRGSSSKGSVTAKGISKAKPKAKGLTAAEVKTLRQARIDDALEMQEVRYTGFSPLKSKLPNVRGSGGTRFRPSVKRSKNMTAGKRYVQSSVKRFYEYPVNTQRVKSMVKEGGLKAEYPRMSKTTNARQKPVPTKPSKTGPQTRKSVKKGK